MHRAREQEVGVGQTLVADYLVNTWIPLNIFMSLAFSKFLKSHIVHEEGGDLLRFCDPWLHFAYGVAFQFPTADYSLLCWTRTHHLVSNAEDQVLVWTLH